MSKIQYIFLTLIFLTAIFLPIAAQDNLDERHDTWPDPNGSGTSYILYTEVPKICWARVQRPAGGTEIVEGRSIDCAWKLFSNCDYNNTCIPL